ncbi:cell wall-binding repeat-containing protein [Raoultibacter phocaeensis]|uniref:cell wall-binding repeat-containing protein n=1 Tax=Raoultibacter phocaeensis TaxID=2479841 RepID=UPI00111AB97D|nr:cell wall-binding repeat-containing protein [Raoultibacter phocaeensis]
MTKTQPKSRSTLSALLAVTLALALVPFANAPAAYGEEEQAEDTVVQEPKGQDGEAEGLDAPTAEAPGEGAGDADTESVSEASSQEAAPQKEEGTVVVLPSAEDMEKSLIGLDDLANGEAGISTYSLGADARAAGVDVKFFSGADRVETSVLQAKAAFPRSDYAIIAGSNSWPDALAASGLAGLYDCPIMLTPQYRLDSGVAQALKDMGVKHVFVLGDAYSISADTATAIKNVINENPVRLSGADRYETQMAIYNYGLSNSDNKTWKSELAVVANGGDSHFADALSASSGAFAQGAPVFLANSSGVLNSTQRTALTTGASKGLFKNILVTGDSYSISNDTETFLKGACSGGASNVVRRGGADRYKTSALIAEWMVGKGYLSWDNAAFTTGKLAYDALGGGAAQGRASSVVLLVDLYHTDAADKLIANKANVNTSLRFYGGYPSIPVSVRTYVAKGLGISMTATVQYDITLDAMVDYEAKFYGSSRKNELRSYLDPSGITSGDARFYQYADVGQGYTGLFTAAQLDSYIAKMASAYWEGKTGYTSKLRGMGQAIIDAAQAYNINEVYLLSHAGIESAWGCSNLAQGKISGYSGYYNFFGIAAYDSNPGNGAAYAKSKGWNTPQKALMGAAEFLSKGYIHDTSFAQNTLYNMKWDLFNAINHPGSHYEYATDMAWAQNIAITMSALYKAHGMDQSTSGLVFLVPEYKK